MDIVPDISSEREAAVVDRLLTSVDSLAPGLIADAVAFSLEGVAVAEVDLLIADYETDVLVGLASREGGGVRTEPVSGSPAGLSFTGGEIVVDDASGTLWVPVMERGNPIGALGVTTTNMTEGVRRHAQRAASLAAHLVASADRYTDSFTNARERKSLSIPAELQWSHLPPETFASKALVLAATVEPAYDIAGDAFDYSVADGYADFALLDAMGHGLQACLDSLVAVAALRNARRERSPLPLMVGAVADALRSLRAQTTFVTGIVGRFDLNDGTFSWVNAGHLEPWIVGRDGSRRCLTSDRRPPAGVTGSDGPVEYPVMSAKLERGEMLVVMSDGALESDDVTVGAEQIVVRVAEEYSRHPRAARVAVRSVTRDILRRARGRLADDATLMMLARPEAS